MGLDFSNCSARWSYSGFNAFRRSLGAEIGLDLDEMEGFGGNKSWELVNDPIVPFLAHSDCDGELSPKECGQVGPRLRELVEHLPEKDYNRKNALMLVEAMAECAKSGDSLIFC